MKQKTEPDKDIISQGAVAYLRWRDTLLADLEFQAIYEEEAANSELWLQLFAAREAAGVTRAKLAQRLGISERRVAEIEREPYSCTLKLLRQYVAALGDGYSLEVKIHTPDAGFSSPNNPIVL